MTERQNRHKRKAGRHAPRRRAAGLALILCATGSCTALPQWGEAGAPVSLALPTAAAAVSADPAAAPLAMGADALAANAALPLAADPGPSAAATLFGARGSMDGLRALDCLAQAIYYEARSESEEGQRAVAQVVLNRVRHPAWPNSVCGVVYQGPLRAGGGCQFTFTCDGSLAVRPHGAHWARARQLAREALAGKVFAPVGLSTFYHADYVMPAWAPRLLKTAVIGTHLFYRLPGRGGAPAAFSARYAGVEPVARPNPILFRAARAQAPVASTLFEPPASPPAAAPAPAPAPQAELTAPIEDLRVRPEYRQSGRWRTDAPAALTGR